MTRYLSARFKARPITAGLLLFMLCLLFSSANAWAQTDPPISKSHLINLVSTRSADNLKVSFTYSPRYPSEGQAVQFAEASTGSPVSWQWDFGDGSTSTERNPIHIYTASGFRKVTLVTASSTTSKKATRILTVMPSPSPATFVFSPTTPGPGQTVQFADTTTGAPTSWQWNFGDGATSAAKNPSHSYLNEGAYVATLIASNSSGSKQGSKTVNVASMSVLTSSFTYTSALPTEGQTVQFTDSSTGSPTTWSWSFGDGTTSTAQNPSHAYTTAGSKTVTLTVTNSSGSNTATRTLTVSTALTASFTYSPASPATGQAVQFTNTSAGSPTSWSWSFGDGTTSTAQNPSHAYTTAGSMTVTLTATNSSGSNSTSRTVTVATALTASFTNNPASPTAGQSVQFTDTSAGSPTSWSWSFGDGTTSTAQNPSHAYTTAGSKTVTLTVTNSSGSNSTSRSVTVATALTASFTNNPASPATGQSVQFTNTSAGSPSIWQWNFGDGTTSTAQNPSHTYTAAGSYNVSLTVMNASGQANINHAITVAPVSTLVASFVFSPASPTVGQVVQFTDNSTGSPTSWQWDFNDGSTSTIQNPSHTFMTTGSYGVSLTVGNISESKTVTQVVTVAPEVPGYYVDGSNPKASDSNPGTEALPWQTINKANNYTYPGDTVYIKAGTYSNNIAPSRSGTASNRITFRAYGSDIVTITGNNSPGLDLDGVSYITVEGINFYKLYHFLYIRNNANHNIIAYCNFDDDDGRVDWRGSTIFYGSKYNWVHHCRFSRVGRYTGLDDTGVVLEIGNEGSATDGTSYNLIEDNVLYHGGHHVVGIGGNHNVFRNNYIHNEAWWTGAAEGGPWGNRLFFSVGFDGDTERNLIEGNRFGFGGECPDQEIGGSGGTLASRRNIIRKNMFYQSPARSIYLTTYVGQGTCVDNKIYNNTFWHGGWSTTGPLKAWWANEYSHPINLDRDGGSVLNNHFKNNIFWQSKCYYGTNKPIVIVNSGGTVPTLQTIAGNWNETSDPQFTNIAGTPDPMDEDQFDLTLQASSPCINAGGALTTITSGSGSGTVITVADAGYFMDGWGISGVVGDQIQILGTTQKAQITNVNYDTKTITVDTTLTWTQGQGIALAFVGSAPDVGAFEYGSQSTPIIK